MSTGGFLIVFNVYFAIGLFVSFTLRKEVEEDTNSYIESLVFHCLNTILWPLTIK